MKNCFTCAHKKICTEDLNYDGMCEYYIDNTDYKKVANLMAEYFLHSQDSHCLLCNNHMRNITIDRKGSQGCDGNCDLSQEFNKEDLLNLFTKESVKRNTEEQTCKTCKYNGTQTPHTCDICTSLDEEDYCMWESN